MTEIHEEQQNVPLHPCLAASDYERLASLHKEVGKIITEDQNKVTDLLNSKILHPEVLKEADRLETCLSLQREQLNVYREELKVMLTNANSVPAVAKLVIVEQPYPMTVMKRKAAGIDGLHEEPSFPKMGKKSTKFPRRSSKMNDQSIASAVKKSKKGRGTDRMNEEWISVRLLTGAKVKNLCTGNVTAMQVSHESGNRRNPVKVFERPLNQDWSVTFERSSFPFSTESNLAYLYFTLPVRFLNDAHSPIEGVLQSEGSAPFVVKTNPNQWDKSEGKSIAEDLFQDSENPISWPNLANQLQLHFIRSTRQHLDSERSLSRNDLNFIVVNFFKNEWVTREEFECFWEWYGPSLRRIRYDPHINSLWLNGYLFGFLSREESVSLLENEVPGTFLMRFSTTNPGKVAVSYVEGADIFSSSSSLSSKRILHFVENDGIPHVMNYLKTKQVSQLLSLSLFLSLSHISLEIVKTALRMSTKYEYTLDGPVIISRDHKSVFLPKKEGKKALCDTNNQYEHE